VRSADSVQRAVLAHLLERHPAMLELDELATALAADVERVDGAVRQLAGDSVVALLGERIGLTRAAVRTAQLAAH
jgi:class 3 adenylate cyclase